MSLLWSVFLFQHREKVRLLLSGQNQIYQVNQLRLHIFLSSKFPVELLLRPIIGRPVLLAFKSFKVKKGYKDQPDLLTSTYR